MAAKKSDDEDKILNAIIIACIIGIAIVAVLILTTDRDESFTELYLLDYTKAPVDGSLLIEYGIGNHENADVSYTVLVLVDNETVASGNVFVSDGGVQKDNIAIPFANMTSGTHKVIIMLDGREESVHFWTDVN
ncbi:MAG: DUF1616 domain-containing protein [Candidatus Aenigmarchaeota archaeon]|nr:DUF1616 domain-containing protein [Candidatus Aenigmarchaeota archaeon]